MSSPQKFTDSPMVRRGDRLVRYGGMVGGIGICALFIFGGLLNTAMGPHTVPMPFYYTWVALCLGIGQILVWLGMHYLNRAHAWDSGVMSSLWKVAFATSLFVGFLYVVPLIAVPWLSPVVGTIARRRLRRRRQAEGNGKPHG